MTNKSADDNVDDYVDRLRDAVREYQWVVIDDNEGYPVGHIGQDIQGQCEAVEKIVLEIIRDSRQPASEG